jgi:Spy/CpxP family protein refolding chaperone
MKRYWLYWLLVLSLLVNIGAIAGAWLRLSHPGTAAELALFGMGHEQVPAYLKLDASQRDRWHAMEQDFVAALNETDGEIRSHRERLVREILATQPDRSVIERERAAISALQAAQQRGVIAQLQKEREMLSPDQRHALADLLLERASRVAPAAPSRAR